jgi:hypothetical protein
VGSRRVYKLVIGFLMVFACLIDHLLLIRVAISPSLQEMEEKDFNNFDIREWHIGVVGDLLPSNCTILVTF